MSAKVTQPKFKMPSVYKPAREAVYRCKVGQHRDEQGRYRRAEFRLGPDPVKAHQLAIALAQEWVREVERHQKMEIIDEEIWPQDEGTGPYWTGMPKLEDQQREAYLEEPPTVEPGDQTPQYRLVTVRAAADEFLSRLKQKAERDAKSVATYCWYDRELRLALVHGAIDPAMSIRSIRLPHIDSFCAYWCDLPARSKNSKAGSFGWRSASNRLDAFRRLLRDLKGRVEGYQYPEGADRVFAENKQGLRGALVTISSYDPEKLKKVLKAVDDERIRLWVYCCLNFGMYQADIALQIRRHHDETNGGLIETNGETHLQWMRHKLARHRAILIQNEAGETRPLLLTHYVWPETLRLLKAHAAPENNPHRLMLLNANGSPLWRQTMEHKRPVDNISTAYYRAAADADVSLALSQLRKWGGTAAESQALNGSREVQELYRGERRQGSSRSYVLGDFTGKLTPWLKDWARRLREDGVLYE